MNKRIYRATNVKQVNWRKVSEAVKARSLVFSIDVAKKEQFAMLMDNQHATYLTVKWDHLKETSFLLEHLIALPCKYLEIAMEPTGVYGDTLRLQLAQAGFNTVQIPAKRVHDATEIYDGVPSMHDAKSAYLIGRLYWEKIGSVWKESSDQQREMHALCQLYSYHDSQHVANRNRLEALLQRHWPELQQYINLNSVTLEQLLIHYGSPERMMQNPQEAKVYMQKVSRGKLAEKKIETLLESSSKSKGVPCIETECWQLQQLGEELQHSRLKKKEVGAKLESLVETDKEIQPMGSAIGKVSTAMLLGNRLDPRDYSTPYGYRKAFGLNLKEKSSGQYKGQLKITKRGSARARKYLYLACLRLLQHDPIIARWYAAKTQTHDHKHKIKVVTALMRKVSLALWHVGRGEDFDATKLFNLKEVPSSKHHVISR